jgi:hypothetical protein
MSKAIGVILIAAGAAAIVYAAAPRPDSAGDLELPQQIGMVDTTRVANPSPPVAAPMPQPAFRRSQPAANGEAVIPPFSAPVVVTVATRGGELQTAPGPKAAPVPRDRDSLARELQKELKRVGCYEGELNGVWTPSTRAAMKMFTERINATLPVDEPDPILFTLVQGQQDKVCGKPCPTGQGLSQDGRCMPNAILAQTAKKMAPAPAAATVAAVPPRVLVQPAAPDHKPTPAITGWTTTTTAAATPPPTAPVAIGPAPEGRMALAGPTTEETPAAAPVDPQAAAAAAAKAPAAKAPQRPKPSNDWARAVFRPNLSPN